MGTTFLSESFLAVLLVLTDFFVVEVCFFPATFLVDTFVVALFNDFVEAGLAVLINGFTGVLALAFLTACIVCFFVFKVALFTACTFGLGAVITDNSLSELAGCMRSIIIEDIMANIELRNRFVTWGSS